MVQLNSQDIVQRIVSRILNNFQLILAGEKGGEDGVEQDQAHDGEDLEADRSYKRSSSSKPTKARQDAEDSKLDNHLTGMHTWPPSSMELDSMVTGNPIMLAIDLPNGEVLA